MRVRRRIFWIAVSAAVGGIHVAVLDWLFFWILSRITSEHSTTTWHRAISNGLRFALFCLVVFLVGDLFLAVRRRRPSREA